LVEVSRAASFYGRPWSFDIPALVHRTVREHPDRIAVQWNDRKQSYTQLWERTGRLSSGLAALGVAFGGRVAILLSNRAEYVEVDVALARLHAVRVALNVRLSVDELSFILDHAGVRVLLTEALYDEAVAELAQRHEVVVVRIGDGTNAPPPATDYEQLLQQASSTPDGPVGEKPEATAWVSYTSGTTGRPKGVVLSHRALVQVSTNLLLELGPPTHERSILLAQPLSHGAGYFVLPYLVMGGTIHIMSRFDPEEALELGYRHRIETLKIVPVMLDELVEVNRDSPFDTIVYGAAAIPVPKLERAMDRLDSGFVQVYGQSEAPVTITVLNRADHARPGHHRKSAGRAWRTVSVDVVTPDGERAQDGQVGEIVVRGGHIMDGYLDLPERTAEVLIDGLLWTRDTGYRDDEGYIHLLGRRDAMINSGGFNVAPREVELIVLQHPAVADCAVVGIPDPKWGQTIRAYVELRKGHSVEGSEIIEFCRPRLGYRRPRSVIVMPSLPRTPYGKLDESGLPRD